MFRATMQRKEVAVKIGFMKDTRLTRAKETFMFDCRVARLTTRTQRGYREILTTFIKFTGDITVQQLKPDHVRMYIATLSDQSFDGRVLAKHYGVIRTWIRWLYAQKTITERKDLIKPPQLRGGLISLLVGDIDFKHFVFGTIS